MKPKKRSLRFFWFYGQKNETVIDASCVRESYGNARFYAIILL